MIIHAKFLGVKFLSQKVSCVSPAGVKFSFLQSEESLFNNEKSPSKSQTSISAKSEEKNHSCRTGSTFIFLGVKFYFKKFRVFLHLHSYLAILNIPDILKIRKKHSSCC